MKMKRLFAWLLVLVMCFALVGCQNTDSSNTTTPPQPETEPAAPLLYRVSDENGNVVWLFGSIHVGREDYYPLPSYVLDAFDGADSLAVEVDIIAFEEDMKLQMQAMSHLVYTDGSTIEDDISPELYEKAVEILKEYKSYISALDMYCPAFWSSMIESLLLEELDADISLGIDRHLLERASAAKKEILEVEDAAAQYQMLAGFSTELQIMLLESSVQMYEDKDAARDDLQEMMDLWASGDEQAFAAYLTATDSEMTAEERKLYDEYNQAVIVNRNLAMADYAEAALQSGKEVFICVGAAHVIGDGAMVQLLAKRGYTVACITQ